jgi:eukaryotic-like serine/threonine-protein kinase
LRIGRYEVISHLATGGMAQIYLARQTGLGSFERHVVLKTILRERATDQRFVTMFLDEAKLAATLNHQNVAQVYEVDQADGAYFMAMEYVHGENTRAILETTIRRGWTIPLELAVMIISGAAAGLHHAHERRGKNGQPLNIVHRDVSPANVMVGYDGSVKVLDFGIAKAEERATKTIGGTIKGKYGYMSPEQCKGKPIDRRSDIFALGIVLYELTTLRRAFKGNDDFETMKRIVAGDLVLPSTLIAGYPRELEAIILTALANDPGARFQSAQELIEALDAFTVRAKLTGSNTAMGRFMLQLFGTKKEPWIDAATQTSDHTLVTPGELEEYEDDNDETQVVSNRPEVQRALNYLSTATRARETTRPPGGSTSQPHAAVHHPSPTPHSGPHAGPSGHSGRSGAMPAVHHPSPTPHSGPHSGPHASPVPHRPAPTPHSGPTASALAQTMVPSSGPVPVQVPPDADASGRASAERAKRPSMRRSAERPSLPFANAGGERAAAPSGSSAAATGTAAGAAASGASGPSGSAGDPAASPNLHLAATIIGPAPIVTAPAPTPLHNSGGLPQLVQSEEISDVGAMPLVSDPKLGWETAVKLTAPNDGSHTRLESGVVDVRIRSNALWIVLVIMIVLAVAAVVIAILAT